MGLSNGQYDWSVEQFDQKRQGNLLFRYESTGLGSLLAALFSWHPAIFAERSSGHHSGSIDSMEQARFQIYISENSLHINGFSSYYVDCIGYIKASKSLCCCCSFVWHGGYLHSFYKVFF